jgi:UDP-2,3-diacylglucosamine pyrophosphatase LpxH
VRTLVLSDLHIGSRLGHEVLTRPEPLRRLLDAVHDVDRLVLLGDILELMEGRASHVMSVAEPILRSVGERLAPGAQVVIVPGNHDRPLVRGWMRQRLTDLTVDTDVPIDATAVLRRLVSWFAPHDVAVHYPGVWLTPRTWATHGHYLDLHLLPRSAFGITRGLLGRLPRDQAVPADYEHGRRPSTTRFSRWIPRPVAALLEDAAELARASTMPQIRRHLLREQTAPLTSRLLSLQMRRASIPAIARVVHRLGVDADWVVFGHVHRLGPLPGDAGADWVGPDGRLRLLNSGSWLYEPALVHRSAAPPHPYWPGGGVVIDDGQDPRAVNLLEDLDATALR